MDPQSRTAQVTGGATAGDLVGTAQAHGPVAVTGTVGTVGMVGLALGGGYGPLSGCFGLAVDSVLSIDIVLADHLPAGGPDELTVQTGFVAGPDGAPVLFVAPTWCGDAATGERVTAPLARLGSPLMAQIGPTALADSLAGMDAAFPFGRHVEIRTRTVDLTAHAYGPNSARLLDIKHRVDPETVFRAIPLPEPQS
ncbi:hypothetical protein GCM10022384_33110 [Streptomyces marokkonensis]|uniref:Uncharacterized protein n=1 Tax=Streptomyces marokkonensis TaxID=324855 RepID=A0ABP7QEQ4_9ACTN